MELIASWPLEKQSLLMGDLLLFRKELEIFSELKGYSSIKIYFQGSEPLPHDFLSEIFCSEIPITWELRNESIQADFPSQKALQLNPYSSWHWMSEYIDLCKTGRRLRWPGSLLKEARLLSQDAFVCHLKQRTGDHRQSEANLEAWYLFFQKTKGSFLLLGNDFLPEKFLRLPHVQRVEAPLKVQLALITQSKGFLGMASGFSAAAVLSDAPYVLFKHPLQHVEEMKRELGDKDRFAFSHEAQRLWRKLDSYDNILQAFSLIENGQGVYV